MVSPGITISTPVGQRHCARDIRRAEEELRLVALEERRVSAAFLFRQHVQLTLELSVRRDAAGLREHLAAFALLRA